MVTISPGKLQCRPGDAARYKEWLATRGGLAVWNSQDLSDPGRSWTTPRLAADGTPTPPPSWKCGGVGVPPTRVITDIVDVEVCIDVEVKRFRVGLRVGGNGFTIKVSDGGSRRIHREVGKAGAGAYYEFDYNTQEVAILRPKKVIPLAEYHD